MGGLAAVDVNFLHRLVALLLGISLVALVLIAAHSRQALPGLFALSLATMSVYLAQALIGAANVWLSLAASVRIAHLATAQMLWVITTAVAVVAAAGERRPAATAGEAVARRRLPATATGDRRPRFGDRVRASAGDSDRGCS